MAKIVYNIIMAETPNTPRDSQVGKQLRELAEHIALLRRKATIVNQEEYGKLQTEIVKRSSEIHALCKQTLLAAMTRENRENQLKEITRIFHETFETQEADNELHLLFANLRGDFSSTPIVNQGGGYVLNLDIDAHHGKSEPLPIRTANDNIYKAARQIHSAIEGHLRDLAPYKNIESDAVNYRVERMQNILELGTDRPHRDHEVAYECRWAVQNCIDEVSATPNLWEPLLTQAERIVNLTEEDRRFLALLHNVAERSLWHFVRKHPDTAWMDTVKITPQDAQHLMQWIPGFVARIREKAPKKQQ